jgi:hypothetical protein
MLLYRLDWKAEPHIYMCSIVAVHETIQSFRIPRKRISNLQDERNIAEPHHSHYFSYFGRLSNDLLVQHHRGRATSIHFISCFSVSKVREGAASWYCHIDACLGALLAPKFPKILRWYATRPIVWSHCSGVKGAEILQPLELFETTGRSDGHWLCKEPWNRNNLIRWYYGANPRNPAFVLESQHQLPLPDVHPGIRRSKTSCQASFVTLRQGHIPSIFRAILEYARTA